MAVDTKKYLDTEGLSYLWGKIKTYVGETIESGTSDTANKIHFVVPNEKEATEALTATASGIDALSPGLAIALRMPFDSVASQTLNINSLGAKPIYYQSSNTDAGKFPSGAVVFLVYETTSIATGCFKAVYSYDGAQPSIYQGATASSAGTAGLVPAAASAERNKYLKGDGTWAELTLPSDYVGATSSASGVHGLVPAATSANREKYLRGDGTWQIPYTHPTGAGSKHIPAGGTYGQILVYSSNGTAAWTDLTTITNAEVDAIFE